MDKFEFLNSITRGKKNECWEWCRGRNNRGYGTVNFGGKVDMAHRVSYLLHVGSIPTGKRVLHKCDNPPCCNPNHLFLGTQSKNIRDCVKKGRFVSGLRFWRQNNHDGVGKFNANTDLNNQKVLSIRKLAARTKLSQAQIGRRYGIGQQNVCLIVNRKTWTHI